MKLHFLFLPFTGFRQPGARYLSGVGARYTKPAEKVSCGDCLHGVPVEEYNYNYTHNAKVYKENTHLPRVVSKSACSLFRPYKPAKIYEVHPCEKFWERFKLKKL